MKKRIVCRPTGLALVTGVLLLLVAGDAMALNGLLFYGVGARNRAMGGAGAAAPLDTSTILINPAGLSRIGTSTDIDMHVLDARRFLDTSGSGPILDTAAGRQESGQTIYVTPFGGLSYKAPGSRWAFGVILAGVAGEGASYNHPRINPSLLTPPGSTYDTSSFLFIIKGIPAVSYDVTDRLSVGVGIHINVAMFSSDLALGKSGFPENSARGRLAVSYGIGVQTGALYKINNQWSVGGSFTSPQWFTPFYRDLLPNFELPPEVRVGVAYRPTQKLLLALDYKWIGWSTVDLFGKLPTQGGFGWRDQHTIAAGVQYHFNRHWTGRMGLNYGRSPIPKDMTFANAIVPTVYETSLAVGGEYHFNKITSVAVSVVRTLPTQQSDTGKGDKFSQLGKGTTIGYNGWDADLQWTVKF